MIKAAARGPDGRTLIMLGLSFGNLQKFKEMPGDTFIKIDGKDLGVPVDIVIFSGETEMAMMESMKDMIGPETKVHIDKRSKN